MDEYRNYSTLASDAIMPMPDIAKYLEQLDCLEEYQKEIKYAEENLFMTLPYVDELTASDKRCILQGIYNVRDLMDKKIKMILFNEAKEDYKLRTTAEQRKKLQLKIPSIVTDPNRLTEMYQMQNTILHRMTVRNIPASLKNKVDNTLQRIIKLIKLGKARCTRDIWRSIKMMKIGTEKEIIYDSILMITSGHLKLQEAIKNEPKVLEHLKLSK